MAIAELDWRLRGHEGRLVLAAADQIVVPEEPDDPTVPTAPVLTIEQQLRAWTNSEAFRLVGAVHLSGHPSVIVSSTLEWPDLSGGVYTLLDRNQTWDEWDSRRLTHLASGKTITQSVKGRNEAGAITGYTVTIS